MSARSFHKTQTEFLEVEDRLGKLVEELGDYRRRTKADNFRDQELVKQGEQTFDAAKKDFEKARRLFAKLQEMHEEYWRAELTRLLDEARAALLPLARAHRIAAHAFGAGGHLPVWIAGKLDTGLLAEAEAAVAKELTEIPMGKPKSFVIELADDEVW